MKSCVAVLLLTLVGATALVAQRMPPGYLKEMPEPDRVLSSFEDDNSLDKTARQFGALSQLEKMVEDLSEGRFSKNQLTSEERRIWDGYNAALSRIETPHFDAAETRRLGRNSPLVKWSGLRSHYALDTPFRNELLDRFFSPAWKSSFLAVKARQGHERQAFTRRQNQQQLASGNFAAAAPAADSTPGPWKLFMQGFLRLALGLVILALILALRNTSGARLNADFKEALALPDSLRRIKVFRAEYDVSCQSGKLYDKELWTETNVTTTTSGGGAYQAGATVHSTPVTTSTRVRSTVYHRIWLRSLDGRESWRRFSDDAFPATRGQVISTIDSGSEVLMAYNHSTGQFASWLSIRHNANVISRAGCWTIAGIAFAGYLWNVGILDYSFPSLCLIGIVWMSTMIFIWGIHARIFNTMVTNRRNRQFEKRVAPGFRRFLTESTPELLARFRALPT
jgi:hypothetical protein